jgi:hypothetical protein
MQTYAILRRAAWGDSDELIAAAERSTLVGDEMADEVRWLRSYILEDPGDRLGTVCIYQATTPEAIREHAQRVGMPADEIIRVAQTVVVRADPLPVAS